MAISFGVSVAVVVVVVAVVVWTVLKKNSVTKLGKVLLDSMICRVHTHTHTHKQVRPQGVSNCTPFSEGHKKWETERERENQTTG